MKVFISIAVVVVLAVVGFFIYRENKPSDSDTKTQTQQPPPPPPAPKPTPPPPPKTVTPPPPPPTNLPTDDTNDEPVIRTPNDLGDDLTTGDGTYWEGKLTVSDKLANGNLMLVIAATGKTVYFQTSRDYSALVDKEVVVTYSGTLESFTLLDIKAK